MNTGILSKAIFESAGPEILNECRVKYPTGIDSGKIAVTSAGKIKGVKYLYHVAPSNYQKTNQAELVSYILYFLNLLYI